jgi:hypothetical protein
MVDTRSQSSSYTRDKTDDYSVYLNAVARQHYDNAAAYVNNSVVSSGPLSKYSGTPRSVISAEGFPPSCKLIQAEISSTMYIPYSTSREISFVVLGSFGQGWHADTKGTGWLNSTSAGQGAIAVEYKADTVYIARGSDPITLFHGYRIASESQKHAGRAATQPAHFLVSRLGDLYVVGDCNIAFKNCAEVQETCLSILLEEALFVRNNPRSSGNKAIWGNSFENVVYADYSEQQLRTLAILLRKLELVYPALKARNLCLSPGSARNAISGYVDAGALSGGNLIGTEHTFNTEKAWADLFVQVDSYTNVTAEMVFESIPAYRVGALPNTTLLGKDPEDSYGGKVTEQIQIDMMARKRAEKLLNRDKSAYNTAAANSAQKRAIVYEEKAARSQTKRAALNAEPTGLPSTTENTSVGVVVV